MDLKNIAYMSYSADELDSFLGFIIEHKEDIRFEKIIENFSRCFMFDILNNEIMKKYKLILNFKYIKMSKAPLEFIKELLEEGLMNKEEFKENHRFEESNKKIIALLKDLGYIYHDNFCWIDPKEA